jgi:subtilisin family serine protease
MHAEFRSAMRAMLRAGIIAASLSASGEVLAAGGPTSAEEPITLLTNDAATMAPGGPASQLISKAQAQGNVRVIVMLRLVMRMEHALSGMEVKRQRDALHAMQDGVASRVLGSAADPDVVRYDIIPAMSLLVTAAELRKLLSDPAVVSIHEDVPMQLELAESIPLIHADDVWAKGFNGTGYTVAVIDTGVERAHPMFAGKLASEACYSTPNAAAGILPSAPAEWPP